MGGSTVERRWIEYNGAWNLFKINDEDPRYADSQPYDPELPDNGRPTQTLAELRDAGNGDGGDVRNAARQPAAKKVAPAKKTAKKTAAAAASDSTGDDAPPAGDSTAGEGDAPPADDK